MTVAKRVEDGLSQTMRWSAHHAWKVLGVVLTITVGAVAALVSVEPNVETDIQSGYFATYDDQANAFRELRSKVAGVNSEIVYFELQENAMHNAIAVENVTSMEALRAQEELFAYVKSEFADRAGVDKVISHTSLPYFVKLLNKEIPSVPETLEAGQVDGCFCLPEDPITHGLVLEVMAAADSSGAIGLYHSDDFKAAVMFIIYDPDTSVLSKKETGGLINEIIEDYRALLAEEGTAKEYDLWKDEYFDSWGVQSWIYRIDEQVEEESKIFIAAVFVFLTLTLFLLFRNFKRTAIGVATVALILTWTLAGMTLGGVSIGFVSMAMFPLLLGVGVDYVIHIINEFGTERAHTDTPDEAFDLVGRRGAVALFISSLTTISGFVVMITSTSPMIVEIGTATILGIISVFLLSITFVPAMLHLSIRNEAREVFRPSKAVADFAEAAGKNKAITITALLVGTVIFASFIPKTEYVVGTVEVNLPQKELWTHDEERAHMLDMYERFQETIRTKGQELVITKATGPDGLATAAAIDDMVSVHKAMASNEFVQASGGAVNSVPFVLNLYALLEDPAMGLGKNILYGCAFISGGPPPTDGTPLEGTPIGDVVAGLEGPDDCPGSALEADWDNDFGLIQEWDDAQVKAAYDDMLAREEWKPLLLTFMDEDFSIAWALTFVDIEVNQDASIRMDAAFKEVVEQSQETDTTHSYFGTLTGIKKYNDYTQFWLTLSSIVSLFIVCCLVGLFTKSWRAVFAVATPMSLTFIWWLGALPMPAVDIDLAFIFMIPIAFITSLGSDYAVHLAWNLEKQPSARFVFKTVGKAVFYSAFTTAVAFWIFTRGAIRGSYEMFEAAVIAIIIMATLTLVSIPLFYFKRGVDHHAIEAEAEAGHSSSPEG